MQNETVEPAGGLSGSQFQVRDLAAPWVFGVLLGICFLSLVHNTSFLSLQEGDGVEQGAFMDDRARFDKDVGTAPISRQLGFIGLIALGGMAWVTGSPDSSGRLRWGAVLLAAGAALLVVYSSVVWSAIPGKTLRELVRITAYALVALGFARRFRPTELAIVLAVTLGMSVLAATFCEAAVGHFRPWVSGYRLTGTLHSNTLAAHAMLLTLLAAAFMRHRGHPVWYAIFFAAFAVLLLTKTRGALMATLVATCVCFLAGRNRQLDRVVQVGGTCLGALCLTLVLAMASGVGSDSSFDKQFTMGRGNDTSTFTGRMRLWELLFAESEDERMLGFGYGAFWEENNLEMINDELEWYANHAHNSYVHTIMDIGVLGLIPFMVLSVVCLWRACDMSQYAAGYTFFATYVVAGYIDGMIEVSFVYPRTLGLFTLMVVFSLAMNYGAVPSATTAHAESSELRQRQVPMVV